MLWSCIYAAACCGVVFTLLHAVELYFRTLSMISVTARAKKSILSSVQVTTTPELETALIV